ncbi:hypothetical protein BUE67_13650, partial [Corynebacterium diphtheriae]
EFVSEEWNIMPPNIYDVMRDEADQQADYDKDIQVYASDIDPEMVEIAKRNAEEVGLSDIIQFSVKDVNTLTIDQEGPVALVGNPPYGERIGDRDEVEEMYRYENLYQRNGISCLLIFMTSCVMKLINKLTMIKIF